MNLQKTYELRLAERALSERVNDFETLAVGI
jgi:hypothetical protein